MSSHQLVNQNSGNVEWYTPVEVIDLARAVMGCIDLDPASTLKANETVRADKIFTIDDDGLSRDWQGNVWLNRPWGLGRTNDIKWISKLVREYRAGNIQQACTIHFAAVETKWYRLMNGHARLFFNRRVKYVCSNPKKQSPTKASVLTYLGPNIERLARAAEHSGYVMVPYAGL